MDGTLVDSDPIHIAVFIDLLAEHGVPMTEQDYMDRVHGRQNVAIFRDLLPDADPHEMDLVKEAAYRARIDSNMEPLPGARDLIDWAKKTGLKLGVVTNGPRANLEAVLEATNLQDAFDHTSTANDVDHPKPHPEIYQRALDALSLRPDEALVFEDSPSGITAAKAAGISVIGIASSLSAEALIGIGANFAIPNFSDPALLDHLNIPQGASA